MNAKTTSECHNSTVSERGGVPTCDVCHKPVEGKTGTGRTSQTNIPGATAGGVTTSQAAPATPAAPVVPAGSTGTTGPVQAA